MEQIIREIIDTIRNIVRPPQPQPVPVPVRVRRASWPPARMVRSTLKFMFTAMAVLVPVMIPLRSRARRGRPGGAPPAL